MKVAMTRYCSCSICGIRNNSVYPVLLCEKCNKSKIISIDELNLDRIKKYIDILKKEISNLSIIQDICLPSQLYDNPDKLKIFIESSLFGLYEKILYISRIKLFFEYIESDYK